MEHEGSNLMEIGEIASGTEVCVTADTTARVVEIADVKSWALSKGKSVTIPQGSQGKVIVLGLVKGLQDLGDNFEKRDDTRAESTFTCNVPALFHEEKMYILETDDPIFTVSLNGENEN